MHSENTSPNFSAKEQINCEIVATLQFFNYMAIHSASPSVKTNSR